MIIFAKLAADKLYYAWDLYWDVLSWCHQTVCNAVFIGDICRSQPQHIAIFADVRDVYSLWSCCIVCFHKQGSFITVDLSAALAASAASSMLLLYLLLYYCTCMHCTYCQLYLWASAALRKSFTVLKQRCSVHLKCHLRNGRLIRSIIQSLQR